MEVNVGEMRDAAIGRGGRGMHIVAKCGDRIIDGIAVALLKRLEQGRDVGVDVAAAATVAALTIAAMAIVAA
jgi:hypothetical protein